jgi:hypothetical protein
VEGSVHEYVQMDRVCRSVYRCESGHAGATVMARRARGSDRSRACRALLPLTLTRGARRSGLGLDVLDSWLNGAPAWILLAAR